MVKKQEVLNKLQTVIIIMTNTALKPEILKQMAQLQLNTISMVKKIGTYKTNSNGVTTSYDKYGQKTGSFKKDSSGGITEYDKYGRKVGTFK